MSDNTRFYGLELLPTGSLCSQDVHSSELLPQLVTNHHFQTLLTQHKIDFTRLFCIMEWNPS